MGSSSTHMPSAEHQSHDHIPCKGCWETWSGCRPQWRGTCLWGVTLCTEGKSTYLKWRLSRIVPKESQRDPEWRKLRGLAFLPAERQGSQGEDVGAYATAELNSAVPGSLPVPLRTLRSYPFPVSPPAAPLKALFKAHTLWLLSPLKNLLNSFQQLEGFTAGLSPEHSPGPSESASSWLAWPAFVFSLSLCVFGALLAYKGFFMTVIAHLQPIARWKRCGGHIPSEQGKPSLRDSFSVTQLQGPAQEVTHPPRSL